MVGGSQWVSAKMVQSGMASNAPWLAIRAMTDGLDASAQADDRQGMGGLHQASSSMGSSSEGESVSEGESLSLVAYLTSRVKRRRSRSWASGPGLKSMLTDPLRLLVSFGAHRGLSWCLWVCAGSWSLPYRSFSDADADHVGRLHRARLRGKSLGKWCAASVGVVRSHWPFVHLCERTPVLLQCGRPESWA